MSENETIETTDVSERSVLDIYANHTAVSSSVYDVTLRFGTTEEGRIAEHTVVRMSPQLAKALHLLLARYVSDYEQRVGPVSLPVDLVQRLSGAQSEVGEEDAN